MNLSDLHVAVVGGSYGGITCGLALRCVGADVTVYERTPSHDRVGGGIVVQPDFAEYLDAFGYGRPESIAVPTTKRKFFGRDGSVLFTARDSTFYTGWDTVLRSLRDAIEPERFRGGMTLTSFRQDAEGVDIEFADGTTDRVSLLVAADGIGSTIRRSLEPQASPIYAGYVGFRGLVPETELPDHAAAELADAFALFDYPGSHILGYFIPGERGELETGRRRYNWVWYCGVPRCELAGLLTDNRGHRHRSSLGPGEMTAEWVERVRSKAEADLPEVFSQAVHATQEPFVQGIFDLSCERMVHDRVVLLGDAAFLVRPHTASGTSKAAADAIELAHGLESAKTLQPSLELWGESRAHAARRIIAHGLRIASKGGLGSD